jgi:cobalt/nickel transport system permease protein
MEGYLPLEWCLIWFAISLPILAYGVYRLTKIVKKIPEAKPLLALMGAFIFVISALKLPSAVTGSSSHPTGSGFAAIFFGPGIACVLSSIVLVFQALLLAHGGLTTLGANLFSMGIVGPAVGYAVWLLFKRTRFHDPKRAQLSLDEDASYRLIKKSTFRASIGVFAAVAISDLVTYIVTAMQLALAVPLEGGIFASFTYFFGIYAVSQIPLAIAEGLFAVIIFSFLATYKNDLLTLLNVFKSPFSNTKKEETTQ